jgi:hypothetical protein
VEKALSGGTVCLCDLEEEAARRRDEEDRMWEAYEIERECDDFRQALDELEW